MVGPVNGAMMTQTLLNRKGDLFAGVFFEVRAPNLILYGTLGSRLVIEIKTVYSYSIVYLYRS
jgi:hypothetical protein